MGELLILDYENNRDVFLMLMLVPYNCGFSKFILLS